jgi:hypothetical protein
MRRNMVGFRSDRMKLGDLERFFVGSNLREVENSGNRGSYGSENHSSYSATHCLSARWAGGISPKFERRALANLVYKVTLCASSNLAISRVPIPSIAQIFKILF